MAGDWIKLEHATPDKPEIDQLAAALDIDHDAAFGKCVRFWMWADQQSIDGNALRVTPAFIDRLTNCPGFCDALVKVGWLKARNNAFMLPNFDRHNGQTAKNRALTKDRVKRSRNAPNVTSSLPEKRREEKSKESENKNSPLALPLEVPKASPKPPKISWSVETGWMNITDADRDEWAEAYPACDIGRQLAQMQQWCKANPAKARKSNWRKFITNWLKRAQDKGGDVQSNRPVPGLKSRSVDDYLPQGGSDEPF